MCSYIPPDLIQNMLVRLPIKDVLRCTIVCKSWYNLITCTTFISSHLNLSTQNQNPPLFFAYSTRNVDHIPDYDNGIRYCVHGNNQALEETATLDSPDVDKAKFTIRGCLNGLICFSDSRVENVMLWNPSLRKSLFLPKSRVLKDSARGVCVHCIGFGFSSATSDYKIVRVSYRRISHIIFPVEVPIVEIYDLSIGSWRNVYAKLSSHAISHWQNHLFLKGCVHCVAYNSLKEFTDLILFDMTTEEFGLFKVPSCFKSCLQNEEDLFLLNLKESLCIALNEDIFCSIWVMKEYGIPDSWEKQFNIYIGQDALVCPCFFREKDDTLFLERYKTSVLDTCSLAIYDTKSKKVRNVGLHANMLWFRMSTYVESLVLLKGSNKWYVAEVYESNSKRKLNLEHGYSRWCTDLC